MIMTFSNIKRYTFFINDIHRETYKKNVESLSEYFTDDELNVLLNIHNSLAERVKNYGYSQIPPENRSWSEFDRAVRYSPCGSYFYLLVNSFFEGSLIRLLRYRISKKNNHSKYNQEAHSHLEEKFKLLPTICNVPWFTIPFGFFASPKQQKVKENIKTADCNYADSLFPYHKIRQGLR